MGSRDSEAEPWELGAPPGLAQKPTVTVDPQLVVGPLDAVATVDENANSLKRERFPTRAAGTRGVRTSRNGSRNGQARGAACARGIWVCTYIHESQQWSPWGYVSVTAPEDIRRSAAPDDDVTSARRAVLLDRKGRVNVVHARSDQRNERPTAQRNGINRDDGVRSMMRSDAAKYSRAG